MGNGAAAYSPVSCAEECAAYAYFALQAGGQCWCGNDYQTNAVTFPLLSVSLCDVSGPPGYGGVLANAVYYTLKVGACAAGYYCPSYSTHAKQNVCPRGAYCPAGAYDYTPCPVGRYNPTSGMTALSDCLACPRGAYCWGLRLSTYTLCPTGRSVNTKACGGRCLNIAAREKNKFV